MTAAEDDSVRFFLMGPAQMLTLSTNKEEPSEATNRQMPKPCLDCCNHWLSELPCRRRTPCDSNLEVSHDQIWQRTPITSIPVLAIPILVFVFRILSRHEADPCVTSLLAHQPRGERLICIVTRVSISDLSMRSTLPVPRRRFGHAAIARPTRLDMTAAVRPCLRRSGQTQTETQH